MFSAHPLWPKGIYLIFSPSFSFYLFSFFFPLKNSLVTNFLYIKCPIFQIDISLTQDQVFLVHSVSEACFTVIHFFQSLLDNLKHSILCWLLDSFCSSLFVNAQVFVYLIHKWNQIFLSHRCSSGLAEHFT